MSSTNPTPRVRCANTAILAETLAGEACAIHAQLSQLTGAEPPDAEGLSNVLMKVGRVGLLADSIAVAHGGDSCGAPADWLVEFGRPREAYAALVRMADEAQPPRSLTLVQQAQRGEQ